MRNFWLCLSVLWLWTCSGGGDKATGPEEPPIVINLTSLGGQAQKGPFNNGTAINIAELTNTLSPTGRNFSSAITDNTGRFAVANVQLESPYVELRANGYYFNEVSNEISSGQLTLFALSNLTGKTSLNVNILTHLEKNRMVTLMSGDNPKTFAQAKLQAQEEVLAIFDYSRANVPESELLDISQDGAANAKLLAMSAIIQGDLTVGQMSQLLANMSTDIASDGTLDDTNLRNTLIENSKNLDMTEVRSNLVAHYTSLGISATIPDFETEINQFLKPPVAQDVNASTAEDSPINITLAGSDPEGESLTYTILEVNNATVTLNGNVANYAPDAHFNGTDTFTYYVNDGTSDSNIATVTMTVSAEDDEPNTLDVATTTDEDVAVALNLSAEEYDGDSYSFAIITDVSNGTTSLNGNTVTYTPNQDFNGDDTFTFEATDDTGRTINVATATITVNAVNDAPVANDITNQVTDENRMMQLDITLDATDVDGDALTYNITSTNNGSVTINDNIVTYVPTQDWNGEDTFTYTANDGSLDSNTATVTITVNAVNDIPLVYDASVSGDEDATSSVGGTSINGFKFILPEATDIESGSSDDFHNSLEIVTLPTHGKIYSNNNEGDDSPENELSVGSAMNNIEDGYGARIWYVQDTEHWNGTDTFTYKANDGTDDSNIATVTITVNPVNDAPVTSNATLDTQEEDFGVLSIFLYNYASDLELGSGSDSGIQNYTIVSQPSNGTITHESWGGPSYHKYRPNTNFNGTDTFEFKVNDGNLDSNTSTISIPITPSDDLPTAIDLTASTSENNSIDIVLQYEDVEGDVWTDMLYSVGGATTGANANGPSNGTVTLDGNGNDGKIATYTPNAGFFGTDSFEYYAASGTSDSACCPDTTVKATVTVTVKEVEGTLTTYADINSGYDEFFSDIVYSSEGSGAFLVGGFTRNPGDDGNGGTWAMTYLQTATDIQNASPNHISLSTNNLPSGVTNSGTDASEDGTVHFFSISERSSDGGFLVSSNNDYLWAVDGSGGVTYKQLNSNVGSHQWIDYIKYSYQTSDGGYIILGEVRSQDSSNQWPIIAKLDSGLNREYYKILNEHDTDTSLNFTSNKISMVQVGNGLQPVYYIIAENQQTNISGTNKIHFYKVHDDGSQLFVSQNINLSSIANSPTQLSNQSGSYDNMAYLSGSGDGDEEFVTITSDGSGETDLTRYNVDTSGAVPTAQILSTYSLGSNERHMEILNTDNHIYVVSQSGNDIKVSNFSSALSLRWEKTLDITSLQQQDKFGGATSIQFGTNGTGIAITGSTKDGDNWDGFILLLDDNGSRIY